MRVDETGRDDVARRVDLLGTAQRLARDLDDAAVGDPDIGDPVIKRLGVHDPSAGNHDVEVLCVGDSGGTHGDESNGERADVRYA